jgi:hypothetical protein
VLRIALGTSQQSSSSDMQSFVNCLQVEHGDGSFINKADVSVFPVSTEMSGALVRIAPGETTPP